MVVVQDPTIKTIATSTPDENPDEPPPEAGIEIPDGHVELSDILDLAKEGVVETSVDEDEGKLDDDDDKPGFAKVKHTPVIAEGLGHFVQGKPSL